MQAEEAAKNTGKTAEEITEKYGLEAGLWNVFRNKDEPTGKGRGTQAKDLLKRYGSAYLITSITLSLFSFGICYVLVGSGINWVLITSSCLGIKSCMGGLATMRLLSQILQKKYLMCFKSDLPNLRPIALAAYIPTLSDDTERYLSFWR